MTKTPRHPKISIVTVSFNAAATIRNTIESVMTQTWTPLEYIVIDGGSSDETIAILREYGQKITWLCEKDNGIYDAMNKGVRLASGDYILFLGADDTLVAPDTIAQMAKQILADKCPDMWCGRTRLSTGNGKMWKMSGFALSEHDVIAGHMPPHQATISKRLMLLEHPFNINYKISADHDFFAWAWSSGKRISFSNLCIADYGLSGASAASYQGARESVEIVKKYYPNDVSRFLKAKKISKMFLISQLERLRLLNTIRSMRGHWEKE